MRAKNLIKTLFDSTVVRFVIYILIGFLAFRYFESSNRLIYYGITFSVLIYTAYKVVSKNGKISLFIIGVNILFVQLSTYEYLSSTEFWFSFYGIQAVLSVFLGLFIAFLSNIVIILIIGSIVYGDLKTYADELEKRRRDEHEDPFGDDHAERILNE
jgi:hypothetical protein